ncbi:MAG: 2-oxoacid:acceptor oxidoreductase family protein [Firmicutes bacterium]|nr:2-oxoacid:acceptor oxidoreductase family protein [Bacillota bacterium]
MAKTEIRMTGSGGQGVIMGTIILAEAAYDDGKQVVQCQAYGPEARGGSSKAETIVSDDRIHYTKIKYPDLLLSLTQESLDKFKDDVKESTIFVVDSDIEVPEEIMAKHKVYKLPILRSAIDVIKNKMSANIISCGAVNEITKVASEGALQRAVLNHVPKGTEDTNLAALALGHQMIREYQE